MPFLINTLNIIFTGIQLFQDGDCVGSGLPSAVLGPGEDVATGEGHWDGGFLNGGGFLPALFEHSHEEIALQAKILKIISFSVRDICGPFPGVFGRELEVLFPAAGGCGSCGGGRPEEQREKSVNLNSLTKMRAITTNFLNQKD